MNEADPNNFINTNDEFRFDMESAIDQNGAEATRGQQPEHHLPAPSFNPLGTFPHAYVEIPGPADFVLYPTESTGPQGEQVTQRSTDAQSLNNESYSTDFFSNGELFAPNGFYTDMLGSNEIDPYFAYQAMFGESEQSAEQYTSTEQSAEQQPATEQHRPVQSENNAESHSSEDRIEAPLHMPNILPSMYPSNNMEPNLERMDSFWIAGLPTDFNAGLEAGGQEAASKLSNFPTGRAPDISVMINNNNNSNINSNSNINPDFQEQVNFNNNSIGDQGYENQLGNVSSTRGEDASVLYPMVANESHYTDMENQFYPGSGWHNSGPTIPTPLPRASAQEENYQHDRFQMSVYPPPPEINQQYCMGGPQNKERNYRNSTSSSKRHQWAREAATAGEHISSWYGAPKPRKRIREQDEEEQPPVSRKRPRGGSAQARAQGNKGRVESRFEPIPGNQSPQDFHLHHHRREPTSSARYPPRGIFQPESSMANRSMYAELGNGYQQFSAPTGMRLEDNMNIPQNDPGYMPLPPAPNNLGGYMEPQMFHQQTFYNTNNAGMNPELPLLPELLPSAVPDFTDNNRGPPLNGYDSTNLTEQVTSPKKQEDPSNEQPIRPEQIWMGGVIPVTRRGRRTTANGGSSDKAENTNPRPRWEYRLESYYPRVWLLEEEAKMVENNYDKNPRKAFQNMSNAKNNRKSIQLDWDQVELLNSMRQAARNEEEERKKLCKPEEYIAKEIPSDYKPKARLLQCYNAWLEAKEEGGMVSNSWTERKRRTADNKVYHPAKEGDESLESISGASTQSAENLSLPSAGQTSAIQEHVQSSALAQPGNSKVQKRKRASPQKKHDKSDAEEHAVNKPREQ